MNKEESNQTGKFVGGRCWQVKANDEFYMNCFDAFGNRGNYDYFIYHTESDDCVNSLANVTEDVAIAHWNAHYAKN